jgi:hypothetical protein
LYVDPHAGRLLFATHARQWLDSRNDELTTKARDASIMETHVIPQWGIWQLSKIDHLLVQKWITKLGTHRSPATVAEAHRLTPSWDTNARPPRSTSTPGAPTITAASSRPWMTTMTSADDLLTISHDHLHEDRRKAPT